MRSTFHLLEVSKRGLFAQQNALNVTGHNIANANTVGYTRQRANMQATPGIPVPGMNMDRAPGQLGTGVEVTDFQRLREDFLDIQYRNQNKRYGLHEAKLDAVQKIEDIMNEPSETGLQSVMDQMWQAWHDLSQDTRDTSARSVLRERSIAVAETFTSIYNQLDEVQKDLDNVLGVKVGEVDSLARQIAQLNDQIADVVPHGYQPNDLYDQRDVLLDKLSKLTSINVTQGEHGMVNVTMEGQALVTGRTSVAVEAVPNEVTGLLDIRLGGADFIPQEGELAGIIQSRGIATVEMVEVDGQQQQVVTYTGLLPDYKKNLDKLAVNLAREINDLHRTGLSLKDINNPGAAPQDLPFFVDADALAADPNTKEYPTGASKLVINPAIMASLDAIAAARPEANGTAPEGNNENALAISELKFKIIQAGTGPNDFNETTSMDDFYRNMIGQLGVSGQEAERNMKNSEMALGVVDNNRMSVSGVSIDEEMANMVKFQHAYNASARVMTSMDEILDKVINGMGRVGL
ncbi:flagellar hook-associated protein FlgK [Brevibacillus humidisoli]|uniref:flagellar hook-associated protein FlgK n=1 Tax=Brevibacillus humidisoli TaxID=2895522 RepID=UPI001E5974B4|nr:flagellar hook-associated protein FlgK [Brevibacillus humidisoli]UFJ40061.1 flagellar hook-associated protein FlgK [Brevibacillus humidisoli]